MDLVITNALILDHSGIVKADIGVRDGRIAEIGKVRRYPLRAFGHQQNRSRIVRRSRSLGHGTRREAFEGRSLHALRLRLARRRDGWVREAVEHSNWTPATRSRGVVA